MNNEKRKYIVLSAVLFLVISFIPYSGIRAALVGNTTQAALSLSPQSGTYNVNDTFAVSINVNTNGRNIVTVAAYLNYNPAIFQAVSTDLTGSVFTTNFENVIDFINGKVKITQAIPAPGVNTANGLVARVNFKALAATNPSADNITFDFTSGSTTESNVLDGTGTDYLSGVYNAKIGAGSSGEGGSSALPVNFSIANGSLIKYPDNPTVYLLENQTKRPIPSYAMYLKEFAGRPIAVIPETKTYTDGPKLKFGPGALVKDPNSAAIFLILDDGSKYGFKSAEEFNQFGYRFDLIQEITAEELNSYPTAAVMPSYHPTGSFVKYADNPTVYRIENNAKRPVTSPDVFLFYTSWKHVVTIDRSFVYSDAPLLTFPDGVLIKGSAPAVFFVEGGKRRGFASAESLLNAGYNFSQIKQVSDSDLNLHEQGTNI